MRTSPMQGRGQGYKAGPDACRAAADAGRGWEVIVTWVTVIAPCAENRSGTAVSAENLCDQAILANHAAGAVMALDPDLIQIGDAGG